MTKAKIKAKTQKVEPETVNNEELENRLKRALADYHNLEKRIEEERKLLSKLSATLLIEKLLPVLDNLENAQIHLKDEGLEMVLKQFKDILAQEGVEEIPSIGTQFDPHFHEAVEIQQGGKDNIIVKVIIKGYKIEETVLRHAKVVVERKKVADSIQSVQNTANIDNQEDQTTKEETYV
ncbi:nucleotide exchange factor GrpE [Candidatus Curtissbacteria bacterium RBG_13_35_7]|uniref:Protein GrpE n=1 Tax=Candidatus Curtissbacteria bacterium RBG_13_35_7 TaxID=1797705 RepID=A0A1F5G0P6_9BACT|nr:MAG: nucleotide exchange factor GrpE [Candidatus Curtissbacteria bacterium RBG_13_35_7]